ncbi:MAG: regulatory protein RecX [Candidatus Binatia bacterium]
MRGPKADNAFNRAVKLLRYRDRSEAEIRAKLNQLKFSKSAIETALKRLASLHLLNDDSFARNWALTRVEQRGYGPLRVALELQQKGISKPLINEIIVAAFAGANAGVTARAKNLLERRFRGKDLHNPKNLRRAAALLERRGYPSSVIVELLGQPREES